MKRFRSPGTTTCDLKLTIQISIIDTDYKGNYYSDIGYISDIAWHFTQIPILTGEFDILIIIYQCLF